MEQAKQLFLEMRERNLKPTTQNFTTLPHSYSRVGDRSEVIALYQNMVAKGIKPDRIIYHAVLDVHCREGNLVEALKLLDTMLEKGMPVSTTAYEALIQMLCTKGEYVHALSFLSEMGEKGIGLNLATCRTITCGFLTAGMVKAERLLEIMVRFGLVSESTDLYDLVDQNQADVNSEGTFGNQIDVEFEDAAEHVIDAIA